jgi:hypothetical protein
VCWFFAINGLGSGQTRERIPSNAWARKIAAPTKLITAVIVSDIANVPLRYLRDRKRRPPCTVKAISGHQRTARSIEEFAQHHLVIQSQGFGISRHAA